MQYTNKGGRKGSKRGDRAARKTHYGFTEDQKKATSAPLTGYNTFSGMDHYGYGTGSYASTQPKFAPVSDEVTVYGAKKFRTPYTKDEYTGTQGSPIPAYVFDIDGTLQGYGQGADKDTLAWAAKLYKADPKAVFLVITARDHGSFGYENSFNWLMRHFPYPFIGPFARPKDDPRYASEFKRELAQGFEDMGLYQILGAADDNKFVNDMWKQWAIDHFEDPKDFNLLECSYGSYAGWRSDLPAKGTGYTSSYTSGTNYHKDEHWNQDLRAYESDFRDGERWVVGATDPDTKKWVPGHWVTDPTAKAKSATATPEGGKHRAAGTSAFPTKFGTDPVDKVWKRVDEFIGLDLSENPAWKAYFDKRTATGAYVGEKVLTDEDQDELDEVIEAFEAGYAIWREDLKQIVRHDDSTSDIPLTDDELDEMSDEELRELAGLYIRDGEGEEYDGDPLFSDDQLGIVLNPIADQESAEERNARIQYRLDIEDEVYAIRQDLKANQISEMDLKVLESYIDQPTLDAIHDRNRVFTGEVRDILADTGPLDVAEVLGELAADEAQALPAPYAVTNPKVQDPKVQAVVDEYLASKNGALEPFPKVHSEEVA